MFFVVAVLLLIVLPSNWNLVGFALALVCFAGEVAFWQRRVRGRHKAVGAQTLLGQLATVVASCRPIGQVRIDGEIWAARCDTGADPGEIVTVVGRQKLTLLVEPSATEQAVRPRPPHS